MPKYTLEIGCKTYDIDFTSSREGGSTTNLTYAAVTSRSYHRAGVNAAFTDGSVRFIPESIALTVWQALATRAQNEPVSPP